MEDIWDFINTVDVEDLKHVLDPQIRCNMAIAEEGLKGNYGANIGSVLLAMNGDDIRTRARALSLIHIWMRSRETAWMTTETDTRTM